MAENIVGKLAAQRKAFYRLACLERNIEAQKAEDRDAYVKKANAQDFAQLAGLWRVAERVKAMMTGDELKALDKRDAAIVLGWEVPNLDKLDSMWGIKSETRQVDGSKLKSYTVGQLRTLLVAMSLEETAKRAEYMARADADNSADKLAERVINKATDLDQNARDRVAASMLNITVEQLHKMQGK